MAITFTNKAAAEMRARILDWMKRIILDITFDGSPRRPIDELMESMGGIDRGREMGGGSGPQIPDAQSAHRLIQGVIERNFEHVLRNYYDFNVGTIDSFVNLTLKASAFKLGLPPDFDISTESDRYVDLVLRECLQKIMEDDDVKEKFDRFLRNYVELEGESSSWVPKAFLRDIISNLWNEETKENLPFAPAPQVSPLEEIKSALERDVARIREYLSTTEGMKPHSRFLKALERFSPARKTDMKISDYFKRATLGELLNKNSAPTSETWEAVWQDVKGNLAAYVETLAETRYASYIEIYELFKETLRWEITFHRRLILIEQLNSLLQRVINEKEFVPEIYYALAERYSHFLIDEFQDTNHLQWNNIEILAEEALSRGGTLLLVGDKKQAIYRWRGGRAQLVDKVSSRYRSYGVEELDLDKNYRSGEHLVRFNNIIFDPLNIKKIAGALKDEIPEEMITEAIFTYSGSGQGFLEGKRSRGYVRVEKLMEEGDGGAGAETSLPGEGKDEQVGARLKTLIRELTGRNVYEYRDIAVLVRRKEEARFVVKILLGMDVNVESEMTINIKNNPLVREMICFLSFIHSPRDDLSFAGFLTGSIFQKRFPHPKDHIVHWISRERIANPSGFLYRSFQRDFPGLWDDLFGFFFRNSGYMPLYDFVVLFYKTWGVLRDFPDDNPFFLRLCELIKEQEGKRFNDLARFLEFWRDRSEGEGLFTLQSMEGTNAVKVMTIHKAKGLQFPVVILPFLKMSSFGSSDRRDKTKYFAGDGDHLRFLYIKKGFIPFSRKLKDVYDKEGAGYILDELNGMYVGCTRAEKELYAFLPSRKRRKNYLIDYLFNLEDLKDYNNGNVIEMGEKPGGSVDWRGSESEADGSRPCPGRDDGDGGPFHDLEEDIRWMGYVGAKVEDASDVSLEKIFAKKKGDVIHYILSLVQTAPEDGGALLRACVKAGIGKYGFHNREREISAMVEKVFANPRLRHFFTVEEGQIVYREQEIVDTDGETYKVDRIIVGDDHVDIIDFKTGETHSPVHEEQIKRYGSLAGRMWPDKTVTMRILYLDTGEVKEI